MHLSEHGRRWYPGCFVQNSLWQVLFEPVQVVLPDKGQVLRVVSGFGLTSAHVALDEPEGQKTRRKR